MRRSCRARLAVDHLVRAANSSLQPGERRFGFRRHMTRRPPLGGQTESGLDRACQPRCGSERPLTMHLGMEPPNLTKRVRRLADGLEREWCASKVRSCARCRALRELIRLFWADSSFRPAKRGSEPIARRFSYSVVWLCEYKLPRRPVPFVDVGH